MFKRKMGRFVWYMSLFMCCGYHACCCCWTVLDKPWWTLKGFVMLKRKCVFGYEKTKVLGCVRHDCMILQSSGDKTLCYLQERCKRSRWHVFVVRQEDVVLKAKSYVSCDTCLHLGGAHITLTDAFTCSWTRFFGCFKSRVVFSKSGLSARGK